MIFSAKPGHWCILARICLLVTIRAGESAHFGCLLGESTCGAFVPKSPVAESPDAAQMGTCSPPRSPPKAIAQICVSPSMQKCFPATSDDTIGHSFLHKVCLSAPICTKSNAQWPKSASHLLCRNDCPPHHAVHYSLLFWTHSTACIIFYTQHFFTDKNSYTVRKN